MPNIGWGELLVILLVALLVFGPNKLPEMMRGLGKAVRAFQDESSRAAEQLRAAVEAPSSEHGVIDRPDVPMPTPAANGPPATPEIHEDT